jgi:hypothetical protein
MTADTLRTQARVHFDLAKQAARFVRMFPDAAAYWREKAANDLDIALGCLAVSRRRKIEENADMALILGREETFR